MLRISVLNKQTALRAKELGALGETLAQRYLERAGFTGLLDLNTLRKNFPFADVVASRGGTTYAISVKTRNKYEARTGNLNARYKLGKKCEEMAAHAAKHTNAVPAWLAIQVDGDRASVYFGTLEILKGSKGITMTPDMLDHYECLAKDELHGCQIAHLKNTYNIRTDASQTEIMPRKTVTASSVNRETRGVSAQSRRESVFLHLCREGWHRFGPFRRLSIQESPLAIVDDAGAVIARWDGQDWRTTDPSYLNYAWNTPTISASPIAPRHT